MPRNFTESGMSYTARSSIYKPNGEDVGTPFSTSYTKRTVVRPDAVKTVRSQGFRPPTPWLVTDNGGKPFCTGRVQWETDTWRYTLDGDSAGVIVSFGNVVPPDAPNSNDESRAIAQALLKVKDQKVNLSVAAAEMHKSVAMIGSRALSLVAAVRAVKRGDVTGAARLLGVAPPKGKLSKSAASNWLELVYGWMPLLQDIHGAYELATEKQRTYGQVITGKSSVVRKINQQPYYNGPVLSAPFTLIQKDTGVFTTKVSLSYRVTDTVLTNAAQAGLDNPLTVAWELTPWSFLIDWFIPIGNFLEALTAANGLTFLGGSCTKVSRAWRENTINTTGAMKSTGSMYGIQNSFSMNRTTYVSSPLPNLYYKSPLSVGHAANAAALLIQVLKR